MKSYENVHQLIWSLWIHSSFW